MDPQHSMSTAQLSWGSLPAPVAVSKQATNGPPTSAVPAADVDIPVDIARQAVLHVHANFASKLSQHLSTDCTCLSKPLRELLVTAIRAVTGDALLHLPCGSDAQSDSSEADSASDNLVADNFSNPTTATATMAASRRSNRQQKPAAEYWKVPPIAPGGLNEPGL
ncbi:TPA: hypothetical protein ACH3X2_004676 [Trebouxia sp. C0005]